MPTSVYDNLVIASFTNHADAESAIRDLQSAGFRSDQIGSSCQDSDLDDAIQNEHELADPASSGVASTTPVMTHHRSFWDKMREFFGGETEPEHAKKMIGNAKTEFDTERGLDGSIAVPNRYREVLENGGELVSVRTEDRMNEAEQILTRNHGNVDHGVAGEGTRADIMGGNLERQPMTTEATSDLEDQAPERRIQLISEVLRVQKERVNRGEVHLRKEVHTETQHVQVPVTREEIVIERTPATGQTATSGVGADKDIRVPLSEERVEVEKVPVVTEEVRVGKRPVSETKDVADQVRREELQVEGAEEKTTRPKGRKTA